MGARYSRRSARFIRQKFEKPAPCRMNPALLLVVFSIVARKEMRGHNPQKQKTLNRL